MALLVHPADEPLGLQLQCTRPAFRKAHDEARRRRGDTAGQREAGGSEGRAKAESGRSAPTGANLCVALLFRGAK
eukprot:SAG22_NODE_612_length_8579_cov_3.684906_1_plen_74_part_10